LVVAVVLLHGLWGDPNGQYLWDGGQDQEQWQWFFDVTAHQVLHGQNPLFTTLLNYPLGVNLMANTAMLGLSIPLIPVTVLLGSGVTWAIALTVGLAGTAFAWYWMFSRRLASTPAAIVGGAFCGFAPSMISHANAHPNFVVLAVIPLLLLPRPPGRRTAIVLGLLIAYQVFLGEEVLLLAATGLVIFALVYATVQPWEARTFGHRYFTTLVGAGALAVAIIALPLLWQFAGPQSYHSLVHGPSGNTLDAFTAFSTRSLVGDPAIARELSMNRTEENAFFGWPLIVLVVGLVVALRKQPMVRILGITTALVAWLSMGPTIAAFGTEFPGPWAIVSQLPLYESVIESRLAMVCVPLIGALLAIGIHHLHQLRTEVYRRLGYGVIAAALLPIVPTPLVTVDRAPVPEFFSAGLWRDYVRPGHTVVPAAPVDPANARPMRWQAAAGFGFALPEGYFVGPHGPDREGEYGAEGRPTATLMRQVANGGECTIDPAQVEADLRFWRADAVVLEPGRDQLRTCLDELLGRSSFVGGVWVWHLERG
jgi:dolichyl-phosphate beta-glucosyltransferase